MTRVAVILACGGIPSEHVALPSQKCADVVHELVCSRPEAPTITDDDPAILILWSYKNGEKLKDAKVDLAEERANGCD